MKKSEFSIIRRHLEKTQSQMGQLLGVSSKAVQSFEQGWRKIPAHMERQALFLLPLKREPAAESSPVGTLGIAPTK
jgi:DNA-binding XRE family transcriptional regulator